VCGVVVIGVGLGGYFYERHRTGSVYPHRNGRFVVQSAPKPPTTGAEAFSWPIYGYTKDHLRDFPAPATLGPPFRQLWSQNEGALLEFPPVIYGEHIYQLADDGVLAAMDKHTGHFTWVRKLGALSASTPAVTATSIYATLYSREGGGEAGRVVALESTKGRVLWSHNLPSPSESSPLIDGRRAYLGSQNGTVYALDTSNGAVEWTYHAAGAVKASPTLAYGNLYFGDYSGHVQAISESDGRRVWVSGSGGALLGSGQFYSTAAVVDGRVFLGNTDGRIYAYDAQTGALAWAVQTGAYVYSSPAVANAPGLGPTVYSGSYDGTFYAIDARTGQVSWSDHIGGRISGSPTIIGNVVYFADLARRRTFGLGISTGHEVLSGYPGSFDPVVSDGQRVYLTGYTGVIALAPGRPAARAAPAIGPAAANLYALLDERSLALAPGPPRHTVAPPSARPSENRARTVNGPARAATTSVQPPGARPTHPAPPGSVQ